MVTYVEARPTTIASVQRAMRSYAAAHRNGASIDLLSEIGRPQRMALIERVEAGGSSDAPDLAQALEGKLQAPIDRRSHKPNGSMSANASPAAFHMLMHVDVVPTGASLGASELEAQRSAVTGAVGGRSFELATQSERPNHFAVHETWSNRAAYEAYAASEAAQRLRRQLATVKGALFDDRFYTVLQSGAAPRRSGRSK